ncbi:MAG: hypothetical protein EPO08_09860 [Rhodospirillaceae bacterium]|nr:MAG: hypothetical protein EPO08_09860 [Rhodospirillaceae bacterium]
MKSFNVTLIRIDDYPHSLAVLEAAQYIHWCLVACGYGSVLTTNRIDPDAHNIVFCAHLLNAAEIERFPADTIIFNSEHLQNKQAWYFDGPYGRFLDKFYVWDYSLKNIPRIGHDRTFFIPFLFCPDLVRTDIARTQDKTLAFYGAPTERRKKLLKEIEAAGVPVETIFGKYGAERDKEVFGARAILNLRQFDEIVSFEPIRCFYPLTNGIPVISESSDRDPTFDFYKDWVFAFDTQDLARGIAALYHDGDAFARLAAEKLTSFRQTSGADAIGEAVAAYKESL